MAVICRVRFHFFSLRWQMITRYLQGWIWNQPKKLRKNVLTFYVNNNLISIIVAILLDSMRISNMTLMDPFSFRELSPVQRVSYHIHIILHLHTRKFTGIFSYRSSFTDIQHLIIIRWVIFNIICDWMNIRDNFVSLPSNLR